MTGSRFRVEDHEEVIDVCKAEEELIRDAHQEGIEKKAEEIALYLLKAGQSLDFIADATKLSKERVMELEKTLHTS